MVLPPLLLAGLMLVTILTLGVPLSLEFSSGTLIRYEGIEERPDVARIESSLHQLVGGEIKVEVTRDPLTGRFGLDIQTPLLGENLENQVCTLLSGLGLENPSILPYSPALGRAQRKQAVTAILVAALIIGLCLLFVYRKKVVLFTVPCVLLNLLAALGGMALTGTPLSLASLAGLLLLLGYGVDTNILLANFALKRFEGEPEERIASAMKTGFMITLTTFATMLAVNLFVTNPSLDQLSTTLLFGLGADLLDTWFLNAGVYLYFTKKRRMYYVSL